MLANPRIRYIIVCGADLMKTGDILDSFLSKGISEDYQVIGAQAFIDRSISKEAIELFRRNVRVIDLRQIKNAEEMKARVASALAEVSR
ncbi:MAG: hypothetical protein QXS81_05505 [Candidatus Micrarchaeaceae archaeon]